MEMDGFVAGEALQPFGFVQLKKKPGTGKSIPKELKKYAEEDEVLIREQLTIYKPNVIIACGLGITKTFNLLLETVFQNTPSTIKRYRGRRYAKLLDDRLSPRSVYIIETYHPSAYKTRRIMYNELVGLFRHVANEINTCNER
jgi:uracil-DNA glycosylase